MRVCQKCNELSDDFPTYKTPNGEVRERNTCRDCFRNVSRDHRIKYRYGLTREQYAELISRGCEVCGTHENLHVDHDHVCCPTQYTRSDCIRGVLCWRHNRMEGCLEGNLVELEAMEKYLLKSVNVLGDIS